MNYIRNLTQEKLVKDLRNKRLKIKLTGDIMDGTRHRMRQGTS